MMMNEPWLLKPNDERVANSLHTFIIFCEDEVSEKYYLESFEDSSNIKIVIIAKQNSKFKNVFNATEYCRNNSIIKEDNSVEDGMEIWCVYDRDISKTKGYQTSIDTEFDLAEGAAIIQSIQVAWSNDSFELWVLLHFEDVDPCDDNTHVRTYYYDRLTDIFENYPNPNDTHQNAIKYRAEIPQEDGTSKIHTFSYKERMKRKKNFQQVVLPIILPQTPEAIKRAKKLEDFHRSKSRCSDKKPCTLMFKLIESMQAKGGKIY